MQLVCDTPERRRIVRKFAAAARRAEAAGRADQRIDWPSEKYRARPEAFARDILGVAPWARQVEILNAVRDHLRVAIASGHKVAKSHTAAIIALWFYCSYPDARVVMSSTTSRQVDAILWRELRMMHTRAKRPVGGELHELARSGLKSQDFREVVGFTAKEAEAVAGVSGRNLLYILDEASGIPDVIFEAIEGNRAGGARLVMFSNPTRTEGEFARAFLDEAKKPFYHRIQISSEEAVNEGIPGLATKEWIEEKRLEWGVDSPLYKVRVLGQFVVGEDGKILTLHAISEAEARWDATPAVGRLFVGLDPAGDGDGGDESVWAPRRGKRVLELVAMRGQSPAAHVTHTVDLCRAHRMPRELPPIVVVDREGEVGAKVWAQLRGHQELHPGDFELVGVRSSERCVTGAPVDRVRDALWSNLRDWLRADGAIPTDTKLAKELHAASWLPRLGGRDKVTPKTELKKMLGRSPDRADAVALAVWEAGAAITESAANAAPDTDLDEFLDAPDPDRTFDPYGA